MNVGINWEKVKVVIAKNRRRNHEIDQLLTFGSVKF